MVKFRLLLATVIVVTIVNHVPAQKVWSLEDCIQYALENNIQYKRQKLLAETTGNRYLNSKLSLLPTVNGFANASQNWGTTFSFDKLDYVDQENKDGNLGVASRVDLFSGLAKVNTIGQYKYNLLANMQDVERIKNSITLEVVATYLQILLDKELLKLAEEQLKITQQQVERTSRLVEVGNEPRGSLLEIQAQEALEKANVTAANNNLNISYLTLTQLLLLDSVGDFEIEVPVQLDMDESMTVRSPGSIYRESLGIMPEIKSAEYFLLSEQKRLAGARGQRYPSLTLQFAEYTRFNDLAIPPGGEEDYPYIDQLKDFRSRQFQLSLSVPIFNYWNVNTQISNAKVSVNDAQLLLEQSKLNLRRNIQQAHANAIAALENYRSNQEAVKSQQEAFDYAEQRFEVGLLSSVDYNIAKNNLTRSQSDLLQSKFQYIFRTRILDFYLGNPITL